MSIKSLLASGASKAGDTAQPTVALAKAKKKTASAPLPAPSSAHAALVGSHATTSSGVRLDAPKGVGAAKGPLTSFPIDAVHTIAPTTPQGITYELDKTSLGERFLNGGMRVNVRAIEHPQHGPGLEFNFNFGNIEDVARVQRRLLANGAERGAYTLDTMTFRDGRHVITTGTSEPIAAEHSFHLDVAGRFSLDLADMPEGYGDAYNAQNAVLGKGRLRVWGNARKLDDHFTAAVALAGLEASFLPADPQTRQKHAALAVLWQADPEGADHVLKHGLDDVSLEGLTAVVDMMNLAHVRMDKLEQQEVFPGYFAWVDPSAAERYRKLGVQYLYHGASTVAHMTAILGGEGLMSTEERFTRGVLISGASSRADIDTGGADSVFLRMVTDKAHGKIGAFASGNYQLVYEPRLLNRTDWYAYSADEYGTTKGDFFQRRYGEALVRRVNQDGFHGTYSHGNELMFRTGIRTSDVARVFAVSVKAKHELIKALLAKGITHVNGQPVAKFIVVRKETQDAAHRDWLVSQIVDDAVDALKDGPAKEAARKQHQGRLRGVQVWRLQELAEQALEIGELRSDILQTQQGIGWHNNRKLNDTEMAALKSELAQLSLEQLRERSKQTKATLQRLIDIEEIQNLQAKPLSKAESAAKVAYLTALSPEKFAAQLAKVRLLARRTALIDSLQRHQVKFNPKASVEQLEALEHQENERSQLLAKFPQEQAQKLKGASLEKMRKAYSQHLLAKQREEALLELKKLGVTGVERKPLPELFRLIANPPLSLLVE